MRLKHSRRTSPRRGCASVRGTKSQYHLKISLRQYIHTAGQLSGWRHYTADGCSMSGGLFPKDSVVSRTKGSLLVCSVGRQSCCSLAVANQTVGVYTGTYAFLSRNTIPSSPLYGVGPVSFCLFFSSAAINLCRLRHNFLLWHTAFVRMVAA